MPINPNALSTPEPDPRLDPQTGVPNEEQAARDEAAEQGKRRRRTKAEMIADAVVPGDDDQIELKDAGTGAKIVRSWPEAVKSVADGKAEFADKAMKYAVLKYQAQLAATAPVEPVSEAPAEREVRYTVDGQSLLKTGAEGKAGDSLLINWVDENGEIGHMWDHEWELLSMSPPPKSGPVASSNVPPEAEIGDEVRVGAETLRIGHGGKLTSGVVAVDGVQIQPKNRWQRELGSGANGPWEKTVLFAEPTVKEIPPVPPKEPAAEVVQPTAEEAVAGGFEQVAPSNGNGVHVQSEKLPLDIEQIDTNVWKIGTGQMEKIGLPDYSSIQIGPITASRTVIDDGRRTEHKGRQVPTACLEVGEVAADIVDYISRFQRGEAVSFLESVGALKQPVA